MTIVYCSCHRAFPIRPSYPAIDSANQVAWVQLKHGRKQSDWPRLTLHYIPLEKFEILLEKQKQNPLSTQNSHASTPRHMGQ